MGSPEAGHASSLRISVNPACIATAGTRGHHRQSTATLSRFNTPTEVRGGL